MNDVSLDRTQWFVLNNHKDLFFFLQVDKITKPGFFGKPDQSEVGDRNRKVGWVIKGKKKGRFRDA